MWHPVSLLLTLVAAGLVLEGVDWLVGLPSFESSVVFPLAILGVVFLAHYYVWSIPVRLGWISTPPQFQRGEPDG